MMMYRKLGFTGWEENELSTCFESIYCVQHIKILNKCINEELVQLL